MRFNYFDICQTNVICQDTNLMLAAVLLRLSPNYQLHVTRLEMSTSLSMAVSVYSSASPSLEKCNNIASAPSKMRMLSLKILVFLFSK